MRIISCSLFACVLLMAAGCSQSNPSVSASAPKAKTYLLKSVQPVFDTPDARKAMADADVEGEWPSLGKWSMVLADLEGIDGQERKVLQPAAKMRSVHGSQLVTVEGAGSSATISGRAEPRQSDFRIFPVTPRPSGAKGPGRLVKVHSAQTMTGVDAKSFGIVTQELMEWPLGDRWPLSKSAEPFVVVGLIYTDVFGADSFDWIRQPLTDEASKEYLDFTKFACLYGDGAEARVYPHWSNRLTCD